MRKGSELPHQEYKSMAPGNNRNCSTMRGVVTSRLRSDKKAQAYAWAFHDCIVYLFHHQHLTSKSMIANLKSVEVYS